MDRRGDEPRPSEGDQAEERFSTGGLEFNQALQRVLAGGRDDEHEPTDEELVSRAERLLAAIEDGSMPMFYDVASLREYMDKRFPRRD